MKVSDFEAADSGSVCRSGQSPVVSSDNDSAKLSPNVSDQSDSEKEVELDESSESETSSYSETGFELSSSKRGHGISTSSAQVFLTQVKSVGGETNSFSIKSEPDLIKATKSGDVLLVKKLIEEGYDLDVTDSSSRTALHIACSFGRLEIVELLIEGGANVDASSASGQTPLHEACIGGRYAVVQELISEAIDLGMVDANGLSAAHYCAMNNEVKCLTLLCNQVRKNHFDAC